MDKDMLKEKALFAVGLMAAFLAFSAYKEELSVIHLQIGSLSPSLATLLLIFVAFLALSVYFFALDYLRYSYPQFQNSVFRVTAFLGSIFYSFAMFFPLLVLLFWVSSGFTPVAKKYEVFLTIFDVVGGIIVGTGALANTISQLRKRRVREVAYFEELKLYSIEQAIKFRDNKLYRQAILEAFRALRRFLSEELLKRANLYTSDMSLRNMINLAERHNILKKNALKKVQRLYYMRSAALHSDAILDERRANNAINIARSLIETKE